MEKKSDHFYLSDCLFPILSLPLPDEDPDFEQTQTKMGKEVTLFGIKA